MAGLPQKFRRVAWASLILLAVPAALVAQDVLSMDNEEQKDWLTSFVQDRLSTPERQIRLSNIDGALGSDVSVREITISDQEGVWLRVNNASLNWNQAALLGGRLEVRALRADSIEYLRNAIPAEGVDLPPPEAGSLQIPEFPVAIQLDQLSVPSVTFGESVFGLGSEISLNGALTLEGGNLDTNLDIIRLDGPGGTLDLDVAYRRDGNTIDLGLNLTEPANGVMANLLNIEGRPAMSLTLDGSGPVADLRAEMVLLADGETALSGTATIAQQPEGFAIATDLGGPLSTLVAAPYRPFFGPETALSARALLRSEGGIELTGLNLGGGQLALDASASVTPDNFVSRLELAASIADPAGARVTLPVPGSDTSVNSARFNVDFGTGGSEDWRADLAVSGLSTADFAAQDVTFAMGGVASNLNDPATRMVTFNGDGALSGISADEGVEAALGESVGLGIAGVWNAGEPIQLAQLRVVGAALTAQLSGLIDGVDFDGKIALETGNIAPFSSLAGRDLSGALSLAAQGQIMPLTGGFNLTFDGTGTNLSIDDPTADALLAGPVTLSGCLARTEAGISADDFTIANAQVQFSADGSYASDVADFNIALDLADLGLLSEEASGALTLRGSARSAAADAPLMLLLDTQVPRATLAGRDLREGQLAIAAALQNGALSGDLTGSANIDGNLASLATRIETDADVQSLSGISFQVAGTNITGALDRETNTGLVTGNLDVSAPDVSLAAALALVDASGSLNASVRLAPANGQQSASVTANAAGLSVNDIAIGRADIAATVADLFGTPAIEGTLTASNLRAADVVVATLTARASQTGARSGIRFEADAGGIDVSAIAPVGVSPLRVSATGSLDGDIVVLDRLSANGAGGLAVSGSGRVPLSGSGMNVSLSGSAPLALANTFVADRGGQLSGTLAFDANVSGSLSSPQFGGSISTSGSGYVDPELNLRLTGISGRASLSGETATIESLTAGLSTGGSVSASGTIGLTPNLPANLALSVNSARYADGDLFVATLSGALTLTGNLTGTPMLAGNVLVEQANITVPDGLAGSSQLIDVEHVRTPAPVQQTLQRAKVGTNGAPVPQSRPPGLLLDINVNAPNQIFIRGRGLDAEVGGSVRLTGPLSDIQPIGAFALNRGRLSILGQRITFESGSVTLVGDLDPFLNLVARTEGDGITVFVTVSGRVSAPDISFSSSPALPQDEVLSRLIFKRSMGELSPIQLAQLAAAAAELVGGGGGGLVDGLRGAAGLADLDVVTDASGNVGVQAGTYIQDNVYLGVTVAGNGQSKVTINLDVTNDLTIKGSAGQDGNSSLGVFYEQDY